MQVLVAYYSRSGKTRTLAEHIAEGVKEVDGINCLLKPVSEVTDDDVMSSDGVIVGSPTYLGTMAAPVKQMFDNLHGIRKKMGEKVGAAFATSTDPSGGKETTMISIIQALIIYGMVVVGDPMDATGHYGVACSGVPDERTTANAAKLGKRVALLVKKLKS